MMREHHVHPGWSPTPAILLGSAIGMLIAMLVLPGQLPALGASLAEASPRAFWYLARASGIVAYVLLWSSIVLGLLVSGRLSRLWPGGPVAVDLHRFVSLLGLAFSLFHPLVLLGDRYVEYTLVQLAIPFASPYRPFWVGLGQLSLYLVIPVALSFSVRRWIGFRAWRLLHYAGFVVYLLVTAHALMAGTDSNRPVALGLYAFGALAIFFLTVFRVLVLARPPVRTPR